MLFGLFLFCELRFVWLVGSFGWVGVGVWWSRVGVLVYFTWFVGWWFVIWWLCCGCVLSDLDFWCFVFCLVTGCAVLWFALVISWSFVWCLLLFWWVLIDGCAVMLALCCGGALRYGCCVGRFLLFRVVLST